MCLELLGLHQAARNTRIQGLEKRATHGVQTTPCWCIFPLPDHSARDAEIRIPELGITSCDKLVAQSAHDKKSQDRHGTFKPTAI